MKITEIHIGDKVCDKRTKFPMTVVGIWSLLGDPPTKGDVYLDFEENEGDMFEMDINDIEFCEE